jgi:hypothetical protein
MDSYRHKKSGGRYWLLHDDALIEATMTPAVVYMATDGEHAGQKWVRPKAEFFDGRFVKEPKGPSTNVG